MKKLINITYYLTIGAVGLIGLLLMSTLIPIPGNFEVKVVKSGSMEPTVRVGSIVVIRPVASYSVGDVVTFGPDTKTQVPTTHRIVAVEGSGVNTVFQTKGDANDAPDPKVVRLGDIHGTMFFTVPYMGYLLAFARTQLGFLLLVGVPALLVFYEEGRNILREIRRMRRPKGPRVQKRQTEPTPPKTSIVRHEGAFDGVIRPRVVMRAAHNQRSVPVRVMGLSVIIVLATSWGVSAGRGEKDTLAYYADTSVSSGNRLGAAEVYNTLALGDEIKLFVITISDDPPVIIDGEAPPPPADETPPVDESSASAETEAQADSTPPPEPPADVPVVEEQVVVDAPVVDAPPAETAPAETPPTAE